MEELNNYHWTFKEGFDKSDISEEVKGTLVDLPYSSSSLNLPFFKVGTFQRLFNFNQLGSLNNHRVILTLNNISTTINLYLNGKQLLKEVYAEGPVKLDITDYLKEENILTIEVRSLEDGIYPSINFPVYFELVPLTYIDDIVISTKNTGEITLDPHIKGKGDYKITYSLMIGGQLLYTFNKNHFILPLPSLWSFSSPYVYTIVANLETEGLSHRKVITFGFRDAQLKKGEFYLNERKTFLIGTKRDGLFPYTQRATAKSAHREDAEILKIRLGANLVLLTSVPTKDFLNRLDELGLFCLLPVLKTEDKDANKRYLFSTINHPSVLGYFGDDVPTSFIKLLEKTDKLLITDKLVKFDKNRFSHFSTLQKNEKGKVRYSSLKKHSLIIGDLTFKEGQDLTLDKETKEALRQLMAFDIVKTKKKPWGYIFSSFTRCEKESHLDSLLTLGRCNKSLAFSFLSLTDPSPFFWVSNYPNQDNLLKNKPLICFTDADYVELYINDEFIDAFPANHKVFKGLKHPPIVINDFSSTLLRRNGFNNREIHKIKKVFSTQHENVKSKLNFFEVLQVKKLLRKHDMSSRHLRTILMGYQDLKEKEGFNIAFKAYKDRKLMRSKIFGEDKESSYYFDTPGQLLRNEESYDVMRITIRKVDNYGSVVNNDCSKVTLTTIGPLEIIGPTELHLVNGVLSFYLKTKAVPSCQNLIGQLKIQTAQNSECFHLMIHG